MKENSMMKIALVGRPNVGKSTLFNRLTRSYDAITSDVAGTTRDIRRGTAVIAGNEVQIMDTGGLEERDEMFKNIRRHALLAAKEADIVLFMVDGQMMPSDEEKRLFYELQQINPSIALLLNKIDNDKLTEQRYEYMAFGAEKLFVISCAHKRGLDSLTEWLQTRLALTEPIVEDEEDMFDGYDEEGKPIVPEELLDETSEDVADETIRVAIIGRPNVGKSALLNALVGHERSVVSPIAGTTIDPVDEATEINGRTVVFIDTAGIRKRSRILGIEKFAFDRTEKMLERADLALITLDCSEEFTELDERIAGLVDQYKLACIIVLNKYDIAREEYKELENEVRRKFRFLDHAPLITLSALSKKRVHKLDDLILKVYENYAQRIPTSRLNEVIAEASVKHHAPSDKGKIVKIYYATQFDVKPPRIALVTNRPKAIHFSYLRYLANQIRETVDLTGSPLVLFPRGRKREEAEENAQE